MSAIILAIVILHHFDSADSDVIPKRLAKQLTRIAKKLGISVLPCEVGEVNLTTGTNVPWHYTLTRGVVAVKFDHPDGILHVGNKTEITCTTQEGENGATGGQLAIRDLNSRTDLISIETSAHKIRPPTPGPTYTKYGSTSVECKYEPNPSNLSNLLQTLTVRILPNPMDGTLDGENSGNLEVTSGSTKEFQCNLVPLDAAKSLNGKWKATVDPAEAATVTGLEDGSSVKTGPPNSQGYQNQWSSFTVSCTFSTPEGTPIYTFERTVAVKRGFKTTNATLESHAHTDRLATRLPNYCCVFLFAFILPNLIIAFAVVVRHRMSFGLLRFESSTSDMRGECVVNGQPFHAGFTTSEWTNMFTFLQSGHLERRIMNSLGCVCRLTRLSGIPIPLPDYANIRMNASRSYFSTQRVTESSGETMCIVNVREPQDSPVYDGFEKLGMYEAEGWFLNETNTDKSAYGFERVFHDHHPTMWTLSVCVINEQVLKLASMSTSNYDPMEVGGANRSTSVCGHGQSPLSLLQTRFQGGTLVGMCETSTVMRDVQQVKCTANAQPTINGRIRCLGRYEDDAVAQLC
ncbi:hypothetical protein CLF_107729 [Clonorchis sinensis]|uniref:Ig-like domain-containing protein n=1 Tax=Clonorchis sinensis TaxID=79923 RepID=G7YH39_CLOSI|nr:hypothetical protein CLF_107729 [Clonorchis sinensis]